MVFRKILVVVGLCLMAVSCQQTLTSYVNPFVGTDGHGHTFPGAILPFGQVQVSPDTRLEGWDGCSGYHYSDDTVYGFSHTHLSGTGCSDYGDLLLMPFTWENGDLPDSLDYSFYLSTFSHRNEKAEPGYYRVVLDRNRVMAELTVHERNALHRYTFPQAGRKGVVVDLSHRDVVTDSRMTLAESTDEWHLEGYRISAAWNPEQHFHFAVTADCNPKEVIFYKDGNPVEGLEPLNGEDCKALLIFPDNVKEVTLTVGISAVDEQGAYNNMQESADITFDRAKKEAHATWEKALGQFEVEGGSREDRTNFYTALYHCMTSPYLYSDADGRYRPMKRRADMEPEESESAERTEGSSEQAIAKAEGRNQYTVFSLWDTYRALHPLLNISDPERSRDFVLTFLDHYRKGGELTMWELSGYETRCMIGYHAAPVILDAMRCGVLDSLSTDELNELLEAMTTTANLPILGRTEYARDGYLSSEYDNESVSKTLEYAYDDWCIAEYARLLMLRMEQTDTLLCANGYAWIYETYRIRSQSWKNIMDGEGFMHARRNGAFVTPFDPTEVNNHYTEANSWQYSSYVPHDVQGWVSAIGGKEKAIRFLDSLFHSKAKLSGREQSDITGLIGLYAHGNEPSHHAAYLYAYLGQQWKTAELVRQICTELYHASPDGLCGNEDCGQMSAWYVMSAMGFYPVCPGSGQYIIGSPLFDKVTIHLANGKDVVINAHNQSGKNCYVQSMRLNNVTCDRAFLTFKDIKDGCTIDFEMGSSPNPQWGTAPTALPLLIEPFDYIITRAPVFDDWQQSFSGTAVVRILSADSVYYTLDGSEPTRESTRYSGPFSVDNDAVIKAVAYNDSTGYSAVVTHRLTHTQSDRQLSYLTQPAPQYAENGPAGLIDRLYGSSNFRIGGWQGWQEDMKVVVDLLEPRDITTVGVDCLESMRAWIFYPKEVTVEVSADGQSYNLFGKVTNEDFAPILERQEEEGTHTFTVEGSANEIRYVRISAKNFGKLPRWHVSAGEQAWLFVDEITVE